MELNELRNKEIKKVHNLVKGTDRVFFEFKDGTNLSIEDYFDTWENSYLFSIEGNIKRLRGAVISSIYKVDENPLIDEEYNPSVFHVVTNKDLYKLCWLGDQRGQVQGSDKLFKYFREGELEASDEDFEYGVCLNY